VDLADPNAIFHSTEQLAQCWLLLLQSFLKDFELHQWSVEQVACPYAGCFLEVAEAKGTSITALSQLEAAADMTVVGRHVGRRLRLTLGQIEQNRIRRRKSAIKR